MKWIRKLIPPCPKCPYKLGWVKCVKDPCPECKMDNYSAYDWFISEGGTRGRQFDTDD